MLLIVKRKSIRVNSRGGEFNNRSSGFTFLPNVSMTDGVKMSTGESGWSSTLSVDLKIGLLVLWWHHRNTLDIP